MPNGQYLVFNAGNVLTAAQIQALAPLEAWKTSTTERSSTGATIDPDLQLSLAANATYEVLADIIYSGTGGMEFGWTIPSGAAGGYAATFSLAGTGFGTYAYAWGTAAEAGTGGVYGIKARGTLVTSVTAATFGFNWAPFTSSDAVTLGVGSILSARRIL